ncbi:MAG: acyl-CoA thioesterase [Rhodobacteraceae bacterium]|nr:acyl-CoA thioesterase [Paracoccaceae bacterium]
MMNDTVEALFEDALNWPFEDMHRDSGVPTAAINVEFQAPSRLGDLLEFGLTLEKLGRTSLSLRTVATAGPETRLTATQTLVCIDQSGRPKPWPDPVRNKILSLMEGRL